MTQIRSVSAPSSVTKLRRADKGSCPRINIDIRIKFLDRYSRGFSKRPSEAAVIPFPSEETTPPVTKIYFVMIVLPFLIKWLFISKNYILPVPIRPKYSKHV